MKKLLLFTILAATLTLTSCQFDDSEIWDAINEHTESIKDHEERISALEELCKQMNTNISALQTLVDALEKRDYITNISPFREDGEVIGYTISFAYGDTITIYHGKDGADGANGENGYTPQIGVMKDVDDIYYWTLDGEWLLDGKGNKIKAVGTDGKNGQDGQDGKDGQDGTNGSNGTNGTDGKDGVNGTDGKDGVTPRLKIENDYWYVSYDNGATWEKLCKATSESGANGANGQDGKDGEDGKDGITPRLKITNGYWYVSYDNGVTWEKLGKATGEDGQDGTNGSDGTNGTNGTNGKDGQDGKDGADGVTPRLKIENDYWYVSYDNGKSWTQLGKATGEDGKDGLNGSDGVNGEDGRDGDSFFRSVTQDDENVYFTLADGTVITIQKSQKANNARIYYTTSNGKIVDISNSEAFDATIISNTYKDGKGVIEFDRAITSIEKNPFVNSDYITSLTLPDSITSIADGAISNWGELNAFYSKYASSDNRCLVIDGRLVAFAPAGLTQYNIPSNVTVIGANIFNGCSNLTAISIPNTVTEIGLGAFAGAGLTSVRVPDSVFLIEDNAFGDCHNMKSAIIGNNVTTIGEEAFGYCRSLTSITIPSSVVSIEGAAFVDCPKLASVTIGSNVAEIGITAFAFCPSLKSIYCKSTIPPAIYYNSSYPEEGAFPLNSGLRIYVPSSSYNAYTQYDTASYGVSQTNWYIYKSYIEPYYF